MHLLLNILVFLLHLIHTLLHLFLILPLLRNQRLNQQGLQLSLLLQILSFLHHLLAHLGHLLVRILRQLDLQGLQLAVVINLQLVFIL